MRKRLDLVRTHAGGCSPPPVPGAALDGFLEFGDDGMIQRLQDAAHVSVPTDPRPVPEQTERVSENRTGLWPSPSYARVKIEPRRNTGFGAAEGAGLYRRNRQDRPTPPHRPGIPAFSTGMVETGRKVVGDDIFQRL